jgi:uncharacterized damage-inducible protein DinB
MTLMRQMAAMGVAAAVLSAMPALAQSNALASALVTMNAGVARNIVEAAEKMPEADYAFQPAPDQSVRSFGGFVGHLANANFSYCSRVKGEASPNKENFEEVTDKAKLVAGLKASTEYCAAVYKAQTDASLSEMVAMGRSQQPKGQILVQNISHNNEHYGNLVTYMRLKGMVPPSTERTQKPSGDR